MICDKSYQANHREKARRIVIVRQKLAEKPNLPSKRLTLFEEDEAHKNYRYPAFVTNQEYSSVDVWRNYRARVDASMRKTGSKG